jgi:hypothetical protein
MMQHKMLKHVVDLSSPSSVSESWKMDPSLVSSLTQDDVYEGIGDPNIFSPMCAICRCLPARHCHTTATTTYFPALSLQTAMVNTSIGVLPLALQDDQLKFSSSVVTNVSVDTQALVEDVSLVNEINSVFNPTGVNCTAIISLVAGARFISSELLLGVQDSYSH